jgi:hypothetical protein
LSQALRFHPCRKSRLPSCVGVVPPERRLSTDAIGARHSPAPASGQADAATVTSAILVTDLVRGVSVSLQQARSHGEPTGDAQRAAISDGPDLAAPPYRSDRHPHFFAGDHAQEAVTLVLENAHVCDACRSLSGRPLLSHRKTECRDGQGSLVGSLGTDDRRLDDPGNLYVVANDSMKLTRLPRGSRQRSLPPLPARSMPRRRKAMPSAGSRDEPLVGLNARIPTSLRYQLRLHCVEHDRRMDRFVTEAICEALRRRGWR